MKQRKTNDKDHTQNANAVYVAPYQIYRMYDYITKQKLVYTQSVQIKVILYLYCTVILKTKHIAQVTHTIKRNVSNPMFFPYVRKPQTKFESDWKTQIMHHPP